ncbi:MAG: aquaporin [Nocardioides sp.]
MNDTPAPTDLSPGLTGSADSTLGQRLTAEALGTLVLVLVGCGAIVVPLLRLVDLYDERDELSSFDLLAQSSTPLVSFTFGFLIIGLGFALGRTSGAHLNPALSIGAAAAGRMPWSDALRYCLAQLGGAILGGALLLLLASGFDSFNAFDVPLGHSAWGDAGTGYAWWAALLLEIVLTAFFVHVFLGATDERNPHRAFAPIAIGLGFGALYFLSVPAVNGGLHPAKAIGAALFSGSDALGALYVFVIGPVLGALLAGMLHPVLFGRGSDPVPGSGVAFRTPQVSSSRFETSPYAEQHPSQEPIIQDGWMWDAAAQQWVPAPIGVDPASERTQIRPPNA